MPTFYAYEDDPACFRDGCDPIVAPSMAAAAMKYAAVCFDTGTYDETRPLPVIVAKAGDGKGAMRFNVSRIVEIRHEAEDLGEVDIPDADEAPADA